MQRHILLLMLITSLLPVRISLANDTDFTFTAHYRQDVPVTLDISTSAEISTLDPALATDVVSTDVIENLFIGLTDLDPISGQVVPKLATHWETSDDGLTWTFHLRTDVLWQRYDPSTGAIEKLRPVIADDVVYGIKRACDPRLNGYYGTVAAQIIAGCDVINNTIEATDALVYGETIGVTAPDPTTVIISLQFPASYFLAMTPLWMLRPVPKEAITAYGDEWTRPGLIVTNGPYFVDEVTRGVQRVFVQNPRYPADFRSGDGNIERVKAIIVEDSGTAFALYQDHRLDAAGIPAAELQGLLADSVYNQQIHQVFDLSVFYFGFMHDKPPFDNVHVRRAFSAIIDREAFVTQVRQGLGLPMIHFTPPSIRHAPPINEIGIGFNPDYALSQLAEAGYPNCEGMPAIQILTYAGAGTWGEFLAAGAERYLGCTLDSFTVEQVEFSVLLRLIDTDTPLQDRPHIWTLGWSPNYPDANNFLGDVLGCTNLNRFRRPCSEVDALLDQAAREQDPTLRDELYAEVEQAFFGEAGIFPIAPLYTRADYMLIKPWYIGPFETDGIFTGVHWDARRIDMAAKLAAQA